MYNGVLILKNVVATITKYLRDKMHVAVKFENRLTHIYDTRSPSP